MDALPVDLLDALVRVCNRFADVLADTVDVEDPAPVGDDFAVFQSGTGVKNHHARDACCLVESGDDFSLFVGARVSARGHHHTDRRFRPPLECHLVETFVNHRFKNRDQV